MSDRRSLDTVAHGVLSHRLLDVFEWLPLAALHSAEDVEYVHKLRVSTRRAVEALRAFERVIGRRMSRALRHKFRRIRLAADQARDTDVFIERIADMPGKESILARARAFRQQGQPALKEALAVARKEGWREQVAALLEDIRFERIGKAERRFRPHARRYLRKAVDNFMQASQGDFESDDELHQFRIQTKRLRYAIEITGSAFSRELSTDLYVQVESWQDLLGAINDRSVSRRMLKQWIEASKHPADKAQLEELLTHDTREYQARRREFSKQATPKKLKKLRKRFAQAMV